MLICNNISQYNCFYCILNKINAALVSISNLFKNMFDPKHLSNIFGIKGF